MLCKDLLEFSKEGASKDFSRGVIALNDRMFLLVLLHKVEEFGVVAAYQCGMIPVALNVVVACLADQAKINEHAIRIQFRALKADADGVVMTVQMAALSLVALQ